MSKNFTKGQKTFIRLILYFRHDNTFFFFVIAFEKKVLFKLYRNMFK